MKDSCLYWDCSIPGFPRILAQHCFNRRGYFLVIEEYDGRERCGSILVPKGRQGKGWDRFISELGIAINFYQPLLAVTTAAKKKRSFSEVLSSSIHQTQDVFADSLEPPRLILPLFRKFERKIFLLFRRNHPHQRSLPFRRSPAVLRQNLVAQLFLQ